MEDRKGFSDLAQAGSPGHDDGIHGHMSLERQNANDLFRSRFLFNNSTFLEDSKLAPTSVLDNIYNVFRFELLHNLRVGISKLLKDYKFKFIGSDRVITKSS